VNDSVTINVPERQSSGAGRVGAIELTYDDLNDQQKAAVDDIVRHVRTGRAHEIPYILQGYAGTGKTTLIRIVLNRLQMPLSRIALCAPTNRAAKVLANKTGLFTQTIHKLIYVTVSEEIDFQRQRLRMWDEARSFNQLSEALIVQSGQDLRLEYDQLLERDGLAFDEAEFRKFCEERGETILKFEGLELPSDPRERQKIFDRIKGERIQEHKQKIRELMAEDLPVRKKEPIELIEKYSLIMVDEASMVNETIGKDITSFGLPVVFIGDPFQLPPVKAKAFWTNHRPQSVLTRIERQKGVGAGIPLAGEKLRKGGEIARNESLSIHPRNTLSDDRWLQTDQIICGTHKTRERLCRFVRGKLGHDAVYPQVGEKVVAVFNDKKRGIMNGELYTVRRSELTRSGTVTRMDIEDPYGRVITNVDAWTRGFSGRSQTDFLDDTFGKFWWGYAITCHQSQGSEWQKIIVCDDWPGDGHDRWLYTAITRASHHCDLVR
jgi:exodeoxyribonuclease-5